VFAFVQKAAADDARLEALSEKQRAEDNEKTALKNEKLAKEQKEEADRQRIEADRQKNIAETQKALAIENEIKAKDNEKRANEQKSRAESEEKKAKSAQQLAEEKEKEAQLQKSRAEQKTYIARAKAMALLAPIIPDRELQALLAQQAYNFNNSHDGYPYDDAIYNGLHEALEKYENPLTLNLKGHDNGSCRSLVIHKASGKLFSGGSDGRILRWTYTGKQWESEELVGARKEYQVYSVDVSEDGTRLAAAGIAFGDATNNFMELYDLKNMSAGPKVIRGYTYEIDNLSFTRDGKAIYSRDNSGKSIKLNDLSSAREVISSQEKINHIEFSPDGRWIAGAGNDGNLYLWDVNNNYAPKVFYKNTTSTGKLTSISACGFTRDGKSLVMGDIKGVVKILPLDNPTNFRQLSGHESGIEQIVFNHTGTFMATASNDKTVRLWNLQNLKEQPMVLRGHADWVRTAVYSADDEQLLAGMHSNAEKTEETIHAWPTKIQTMASLLCQYLTRNLTQDEWATYVDEELKYEETCSEAGKNKK
jgi:WD40 repeat protein